MFRKSKWTVCGAILGLMGVGELSYSADSPVNVGTTINTSASQGSSTNIFSKERWGISYSNYMNGPTFSESTGGSINHYLGLKHKFTPDWATSFVLRPDTNFENGKTLMTMDDSYLRLEYPTIYQNEFGVKIKGDVRYYAPFSEESQKAGLSGVISTRLNASYDVGRVSLLYILIPKVFINTKTEDGQRLASHGHWVSASYTMSPFWNFDFALYPAWTISRNQPVAFNNLPVYPGFTMNFSKDLSLSPYVEIPLIESKSSNTSVGGVLSYTLL